MTEPSVQTRSLQARHMAVRRLIAKHDVEFATLHAEERAKLGLQEQTTNASVTDIIIENDRLREVLRQHGIEVE